MLKMINKSGCPYIVELLDVNYDDSSIYLIFEYCQTDVDRYLKRRPFTGRQQRLFFKQLITGLQTIHSKQCVHRDIKPNNLLLKLH